MDNDLLHEYLNQVYDVIDTNMGIKPCKCYRLGFPHRHTFQCDDYAVEQREQDERDTPEPCTDGTTNDVIRWMRGQR